MNQPLPLPIRNLADIEQIERTPLSERNLPASTFELIGRRAAMAPGDCAIRYIGSGEDPVVTRTLTYGEMLAGVTQTANAFHRLGVRAGDAVAVMLPNLIETHLAMWGAQAAGICFNVNPLLEASYIIDLLRASGARVLVTLGPHPAMPHWEKAVAAKAALGDDFRVVVVTAAELQGAVDDDGVKAMPDWALSLSELMAACPSSHLESGRQIAPSDVAAYFHTGGTTGTPKLVPHTHSAQVAMATVMTMVADMRPSDVLLCGLPLFHVNAVFVTGLAPFAAGSCVLLVTAQGYRNAALMRQFWKVVESQRVTFFSGVPTLFASLLQLPSEGYDLSSLRIAACGAAPMPPDLIHQFEAKTGLKMVEGYGLTEAVCGSTSNPVGGECRIGSIGLRMPYCQIRIVVLDHDGAFLRDAATNEIGNIFVRGPTVFNGYLSAKQNAGLWLEGGWFNTGDLARMDADGFLWLTGRSKDLIIRGGHNIDPQIIETAMVRHPAVALAAAVGLPDSRVGELPVVYVQLKSGAVASEEELLAHAAAAVPERAAVPKHVWILPSLPMTAVGKTFKPPLREDAIRRVVAQRLSVLPVQASIGFRNDPAEGSVVVIGLEAADAGTAERIADLLGGLALRYKIETKSRQSASGGSSFGLPRVGNKMGN